MPTSPKTTEQKLYEIREFVELINKLNYRRNSENKILGGLNEQKGAPNFMLDQKAGAGFVEKYDLVPGKELYDGYIKKLEDVKFQEMTTEQKQMVLLILCAGIFYGDYEYLRGMEKLSDQQKVALDLMAQDVDKVKNNIVPILNRINTNGRDENLKRMYHNTFDMYSMILIVN